MITKLIDQLTALERCWFNEDISPELNIHLPPEKVSNQRLAPNDKYRDYLPDDKIATSHLSYRQATQLLEQSYIKLRSSNLHHLEE